MEQVGANRCLPVSSSHLTTVTSSDESETDEGTIKMRVPSLKNQSPQSDDMPPSATASVTSILRCDPYIMKSYVAHMSSLKYGNFRKRILVCLFFVCFSCGLASQSTAMVLSGHCLNAMGLLPNMRMA